MALRPYMPLGHIAWSTLVSMEQAIQMQKSVEGIKNIEATYQKL
jgi:hypothetical protein